jgi:DNA recombination protein RmuC
MPDVFLLLVALLALASLVVGILALAQLRRLADRTDGAEVLRTLSDDLARTRDDVARLEQAFRADAAAQRQELGGHLAGQRTELKDHVAALREELSKRLDAASSSQQSLATAMQASLREQLAATRTEIAGAVAALSKENSTNLSGIAERVSGQLSSQSKDANENLERMRSTVEVKLASIQASANEQLERMRATVDEKLSATLSARLGESFKLVSERLEAVQSGFGEMRVLAGNVTDLRKLMTNVKTRGVWGEVQLGNLLEQLFTEEQFERNFRPKARSAESVEFALRLPGPDADGGPVYLPIDSKFPVEDFQRLVEATEKGDVDAARESTKALEARIYGCARDIRDKYINVPVTTNFAVLFLPTESLYAEVTKMPGLIEELTREYRVVVQGPTTFTAFAMALLAGFRTLAIQKRSADIARLLGAVKTDFGKFAELLAKVEERLDDAKGTIGKARHRSAQIARKLEKVEELPAEEARLLLPDPTEHVDAE